MPNAIVIICLTCRSVDDYNLALTDGAFNKLLQVQLVRKVEGAQFFEVRHQCLHTVVAAVECS